MTLPVQHPDLRPKPGRISGSQVSGCGHSGRAPQRRRHGDRARRPFGLVLSGLLCTVGFSLAAASPASAIDTPTTLYVNSTGTATTNCTQKAPCTTIQDAIDVAESRSLTGDSTTIEVAKGSYDEKDTIDDPVSQNPSLTIIGTSAATTTINAGGTGTDLTITSGNVIIGGLTITGGSTTVGGAGVDNSGTVTLTNDTVSGNNTPGNIYTLTGGGIYNSGTATLTDDTVTDDSVDNGSGGGIANLGTLTMTDDIVSDDQSLQGGGGGGGGVFNDGKATLIDDTFTGNSAVGGGAVQSAGGGTLTMTDDTVSDNSLIDGGLNGGGIDTVDGMVSLTNDTITGNTGEDGGGVSNAQADVTLTSDTISGNSANTGGGIYNSPDGGTVSLTASVLENTQGGNCNAAASTDGGYNVISDDTCYAGSGTTGDVNDPSLETNLGPLAYNGGPTQTIALVGAPDPAVGQVTPPSDCPATDQRGASRPSSNCDAGAYDNTNGFTPTLALSPLSLTLAPGSTDSVTATLDIGGLSGPAGIFISVSVTSGPDAGENYSGLTGSGGTVTFSIPNDGTGGTDAISASSLIGANPSGSAPTAVTATSNIRWGMPFTSPLYVDSVHGTATTGCTAAGSGACRTITQGVAAAEAELVGLSDTAVTLEVAGSTSPYNEQVTVDVPSTDSLTIDGAGSAMTALNDQGTGSDLTITGGAVTVSGLTISGGSAGYGGGVDDEDSESTVTLTDDTISGDTATSNGGGIDNNGGSVDLADDTFSKDQATGNGAEGGGVASYYGTLTMTDDTLYDDTSSFQGGGVFDDNSTAYLTNDTITGDVAVQGGGVYNSGTLTMTDDTVSDDTASFSAGGIFNGGTATLANSLLASDTGGSCAWDGDHTFTDGGHNVEDDNTCGLMTTGTKPSIVDSSSVDLDSPLAANGSSGPQTLAITPRSSAFEEVPPSACSPSVDGTAVTTDERGEPRPGFSGQNCDAGAFELQGTATTLSTTAPTTVVFGNTISDSATLGGGSDPSGSISFAAYGPSTTPTCSGPAVFTSTVNGVSGDGTYTSVGFTPPSVGTYFWTARYGGDDFNVVATSGCGAETTTVTPAPQAITFTSSPTNPVYGGTYTVAATGGASGNPVIFTAAAMSVCTVSGSTVTFTGVGTCTILANQGGDTDYLPAPQVSQGFTVTKATTKLVVASVSVVQSLLTLRVTFSGTLTSGVTGAGIAGQLVTFSDGGSTFCSATTNAKGVASCSVSVLDVLVLLFSPTYSATYAGSPVYGAESATGTSTLF